MNTEPTTWTVAYRKPRANRFVRAAGIAVTWQEATELAAKLLAARPDLQVWYTSTEAAEAAGAVHPEDRGNILTDAGRRVRVVEGELPAGFEVSA